MGPGVLSNTTGRGARTRINYMNWDRWKDSNWVRWHKLLPEKQGGWQYQALVSALNPTVIPGSPVLLMHFDPAAASIDASLLLHLDGTNGATTFPDSSVNGIVMSVAGAATVTTSNPKFGTGSLNLPDTATFAPHSCIYSPITAGSPLDILTDADGDFTIEGWFQLSATNNTPLIICDYGNDLASFGGATGIRIEASCSGPSTGTLVVNPTIPSWSVLGTGSRTIVPGTWYHFAVVRFGVTATLYLDGVALGSVNNWNGYTVPGTSYMAIGWTATESGGLNPGQVDEFRVVKGYAVYTANFTPPTAPLSATIPVPALSVTVDSSVYDWPVTMNPSFCSLTTTTPKFGAGSLLLFNNINTFASYALAVPFALNGPLDIFRLSAWTIQFFFLLNQNVAGKAIWLMNYGGSASQPESSQFLVYVTGDGAGNFSVVVQNNHMFPSSSGSSISQAFAMPTGAWHHLAIVLNAGVVNVYVDGVALAQSSVTWTPINYVNGNAAPNVIIGSNTLLNDTADGGQVDEVIVSQLAVYTANFTPPLAPSTYGLPNATGSASFPSGFSPALYLGLARDLHDWSSIDGQFWIAIGTHLKLYVVNQATLYDITPDRKTSNVSNALTTLSGSVTVTVVDTNHQAADGDFVDITGALPVGGLTIVGSYQITVVDPNTYTIVAASAATSSATGGGNFSIAYEIGIGLPSNGLLHGYGTGPYGIGTYGTPRPPGVGVFARLRTWSLDNYGQDLIASDSDGEIYIWQRNNGPNSRATLLDNAPQGVQRVLVDAQQHVIIALGCTDVTSAFEAMLVRWCSFNDITDWVPTLVNTAGDDLLTAGSRIITGLKTKGQNLIFTDTTLYRMVFVGSPDIYDFIPAGLVTIVGPNAAVDVDGVAYFMGYDNFYNYSGTLNLQACDVWETIFDPAFATSLLRSQAEKVVCYTYEPKTEVTWLYPSIGGSGENDRYVTFNWEDGTWYFGAWNRTCAAGRAPAMDGYPYGVNNGYLYQHEIGTDGVEASGTQALPFSMTSLDITVGGAKSEYTMGGSDARFAIGGSDSHLLVRSMLPDWKRMTGQMNLTLLSKDRPQDPAYVVEGPVPFDVNTSQIDIDAHGSQIVIVLDNLTNGGQPSLGSSFRMGIWQGLATPYAKR